jgi:hypothetical protein
MQIANVVRGVPFGEVRHGAVVQFFDNNRNVYIGIKVTSAQYDGILVLQGLVSADDRGTILWAHDNTYSPWHDDFLLEYPDAMLVSEAFAKLPDGRAPKAGDLTVHRDGTTMYLTKTDGLPLSAIYVDMKTGKTAKPHDTAKPAFVISKWAIVVPRTEAAEALIQFPEDRAVQ